MRQRRISSLSIFAGLCSATLCCAQAPSTGPPAPQSWIYNAFIHSHHSAGIFGTEWRDQISAVRPDVMQFHANSQDIGRELADKLGFRLCLTINESGEYDYGTSGYEESKGFYPRVDPRGKPYGRQKIDRFSRHLCFNSPAVEGHLNPVFVAATRQFHPDQIWIDSTVITVNYCYCPICRRKFQDQFGKAPPVRADDPLWPEWINFHRQSFVEWMERLASQVSSADPNTIVTFNHAYWLNQPETPPPFIKNLSADIHSHSLMIGLYSRYATTIGLPFDVMIGLTDTWAGQIVKPKQQLFEEIAAVIACGGSWDIGEFPASRKVQPADKMQLLAEEGVEFARDRRPWVFHTRSVPTVALLMSAKTHYANVPAPTSLAVGGPQETEELYTDDGKIVQVAKNALDSRIYWQQGRDAPRFLTGTYEALVENQVHFDIVNEDVLAQRISQYELVILPEQHSLAPATVQAIRDYVASGGRVLATGATINAGLDDVLGIRKLAQSDQSDTEFKNLRSDFTDQAVFQVEPTTARASNVPTSTSRPPQLMINSFGQGVASYVNTDIFSYYVDHSPYNIYRPSKGTDASERLLTYVAEVLRSVNPKPRLAVSAPRWIDVALRDNESSQLVQILNRSFAYGISSDSNASTNAIEIDLASEQRPFSVSLQPGDEAVEWDWQNGRMKARLSVAQVPVHRILEIKQVSP